MKCRLSVLFLFICIRSFPQAQTCPVNINFAIGDLTHWFAYTGNNMNGHFGSDVIIKNYDSTQYAPVGTIGASAISEYQLSSVNGITVNTAPGTDPFGHFRTVPTINGYSYNYSIKLGSTSITRANPDGSGGGGYYRGVSYNFRVPPGPATEPYTMTYAYAMVLENGTHISSEQPYMSATLETPNGVVQCASPSYYLPTFNNVDQSGRNATLDTATARKNGFVPSSSPSPNEDVGGNGRLADVWTKNWTEVTFDLSPYRGQNVSLIFEADNCVPGGHFAYGYIAIRNSCAGLLISGDSIACNNTLLTYSVPGLSGATYNWIVPNNWTIVSGGATNIVQVKSSTSGGKIAVREVNSCADLTDTVQISTQAPPVGGVLNGSNEVCTGQNITTLGVTGYSGAISTWVSSTDSLTWTPFIDTGSTYTAQNLTATTLYKVVVGNGTVCPADSSTAATVQVDQKTIGGKISPVESTICAGQNVAEMLTLGGNLGTVQNWQYSTDGFNWTDFTPAITTPTNGISELTQSTYYRLIDKNGACPQDTSTVASILFDPVDFPVEATTPADTTICFATSATLNTNIYVGTSYNWRPGLSETVGIGNTPYSFATQLTPDSTTNYVLTVWNAGCPNTLQDTFQVKVMPKVVVNAGNDTSVVIGQPMQFHATSSDPGPDAFVWSPPTELDNALIADPLAVYTQSDNVIKYMVTATTLFGCVGEAYITVKVFKTKPDIFVPNAFTPGMAVNAIFRPIPVGITSLDYFRIYNRVGQLVYNTNVIGNGWDGILNGQPQSSGGYVWMVKGTDYTGDVISKSGTMVLVR